MKRWSIAVIVAVLCCIPVLLTRATYATLLTDTDTAFLIRTIREKQAPFSWFTSDWPLGNHFYRPLPSLSFELDNALYHNNAAGYGLTNALLCCLCIVLLAWMLREITDSLPITVAGTALFGMWHMNSSYMMSMAVSWLVVPIAIGGLLRHSLRIRSWLPALGALAFLSDQLNGIAPLHGRMVDWLPGRTASVMTVFCLLALAAYARYERTSAVRTEAEPTATDEPATKSSSIRSISAKAPWIWALVAVAAAMLAFASYEQAIMLPAALTGVAIAFKLMRYRVRWGWHILFWSLIGAYWLVRKTYVPSEVSGYQAQQFRDGPGVLTSILAYVLPSLYPVYTLAQLLEIGVGLLMTSNPYMVAWGLWSNAAGLAATYRHWVLGFLGLGLSLFTYLPMAWLKEFEHYNYWPMAMRSLFVVVLAWGTWELCVIAISPQARKAPLRPSPAPGSLPRP